MSKAAIFKQNTPPQPSDSRGNWYSSLPWCFSFYIQHLGHSHTPVITLPTIRQPTDWLLPLFCLYLCISLFSSCSRHPAPVTEALRHAGSHRQELKQLLAHYAQNPAHSLKYRAACFLVENMPWHYGKKVTPITKPVGVFPLG